MFRLRGVRARLTASLVALVALTAVVLGVGASWFVDIRLHDQALRDAAAQAQFDLSVIVPGRQLPEQPTTDDIARSGLADTFRRGSVETFVDLGPEGDFKSNALLDGLPVAPAGRHAPRASSGASWPSPGSRSRTSLARRRWSAGGRRAGVLLRARRDRHRQGDRGAAPGPGGRGAGPPPSGARDRPPRGARRPRPRRGSRPGRGADRAGRSLRPCARDVAGRVRDVGRTVQRHDRRPVRHDPASGGSPAPEPAVRGRRRA